MGPGNGWVERYHDKGVEVHPFLLVGCTGMVVSDSDTIMLHSP